VPLSTHHTSDNPTRSRLAGVYVQTCRNQSYVCPALTCSRKTNAKAWERYFNYIVLRPLFCVGWRVVVLVGKSDRSAFAFNANRARGQNSPPLFFGSEFGESTQAVHKFQVSLRPYPVPLSFEATIYTISKFHFMPRTRWTFGLQVRST
jgi:hypothetical protein